MIYLDYAANTPVDKRVLDKFNEITLKYCGNPNSLHEAGISAKEEIDDASKVIADYFNTDKNNIIYTSGSSEANNLVVKGVCERYKDIGKHIIISEVEHSSIVAPCNYLASNGYEVSIVPLNSDGQVDLEVLKEELRSDTVLVSICSVDSELGTIQPISDIVKIVKSNSNAIIHTDATQAIGKVNIDYSGVDFLTFASHKFFGLNGIGALINFNNKKLVPLIHGGKSTTIYRSGTPVTANCVALAYALELATRDLSERLNYIKTLKEYIINELVIIPSIHINTPSNSIVSTINFSIPNADKIVDRLYDRGICVSKQSACSLGTSPSKSVLAVTRNEDLARNSIRISLSHVTTMKELEEFIKILKEIVNENN